MKNKAMISTLLTETDEKKLAQIWKTYRRRNARAGDYIMLRHVMRIAGEKGISLTDQRIKKLLQLSNEYQGTTEKSVWLDDMRETYSYNRS